MAVGALVEIEASIGGHGFGCHEAALRTSEDGLKDRRQMHCLAPNGLANRRPAAGAQPTHVGRPLGHRVGRNAYRVVWPRHRSGIS